MEGEIGDDQLGRSARVLRHRPQRLAEPRGSSSGAMRRRGEAGGIRLVDQPHLVERLDEGPAARRAEMPAHDVRVQHVPVEAFAHAGPDLRARP